jgi:hypothetical protein
VDNIARALKVFVIAGGIALLAGTVLLVALIVLRATENRADPPPTVRPEGPAATDPPPTVRPEGPAATDPPDPRLCELALPAPGVALGVPLPAGARIEQVVPGGGCLILLGVDGAGRQFVALVDPYTGARLSLLLMNPEP